MTEYQELSIRIGGLTSDGIFPGRGRILLQLALKDLLEDLVLNLRNVYYFFNSLCNLVSFGFLNKSGIFDDNENETLYQIKSKQTLAQGQR